MSRLLLSVSRLLLSVSRTYFLVSYVQIVDKMTILYYSEFVSAHHFEMAMGTSKEDLIGIEHFFFKSATVHCQ